MIESIHVKNIATYDDTGVEINGLNKINFIYGANGCGKTTITKCINDPLHSSYVDCCIKWKNDMPIKALVYNKEFRDKNFGKGSIDGVFTLGQATKDEIEEIEKMQGEIVLIKEHGVKKKGAIDNITTLKQELDDEFRESAWVDLYKKHEDVFKEAFTGVMKKEAFKGKLLDQFNSNTSTLLSYEDLISKASTIFGQKPVAMSLLATIDFDRLIQIESMDIWKKKILGKADVDIAKLIQRLNINDWVNEGRSYLKEDKTCPFCQQNTITEEFRSELESYFDETFTTDISLVKTLLEEYVRISTNVINILQQIENSEKKNQNLKLDVEKFSAFTKTLENQFVANKELFNNKTKEPSRSIELISVNDQLTDIEKLIVSANTLIDKHNAIVSNYLKEKESLITSIWRYISHFYKPHIDPFNKKLNGYERGLAALLEQREKIGTKYKALDKRIKEANKNVTSVQPSVDQMNRTLRSFGFTNFMIVPSPQDSKQYQIQREDGSVAENTLSEGEISFITFLYFLQLCKGSTNEETITEERILVIDDPISSLDSNILFVVSTLIKEIIKSIKKDEGNIKQLVLLTHNVYFHKEVSFIDGRNSMSGDTYFWLLRRNGNQTQIDPFEMKNPIHNSYELLLQELKNRDRSSGMSVQNTMRRIIENYFKILGKYADDDLIKSFVLLEEQQICRSLVCWINDGSHCIPDDLYVEHQHITGDKYFEVFKKVFVQMGHEQHFNMMTRLN